MSGTNHKDLVLRAATWLRTKARCSVVFAEMVTYAAENPDAIGWRADGGTTLIEVKVSRNDFHRDKHKTAHTLGMTMGRRRYYMTPEHLIMPNDVPEDHGLLYVCGRSVRVSKPAPLRELSPDAIVDETRLLLSAVRRMTLGSRFDPKTGRWESFAARLKRERDAASR